MGKTSIPNRFVGGPSTFSTISTSTGRSSEITNKDTSNLSKGNASNRMHGVYADYYSTTQVGNKPLGIDTLFSNPDAPDSRWKTRIERIVSNECEGDEAYAREIQKMESKGQDTQGIKFAAGMQIGSDLMNLNERSFHSFSYVHIVCMFCNISSYFNTKFCYLFLTGLISKISSVVLPLF